MSAPQKTPSPQKAASGFSLADPYVELAARIYVGLAAAIYSAPKNAEQKKPDPKLVAAMSFKLAEAFEEASRETDRARAAAETAAKEKVKLEEIDLSGVFQNLTKNP
jgi:hypothetical protein